MFCMKCNKDISECTCDDKEFLHRQLIKLGDMMGDGLHYEPDGKWISHEYKKTLKALGIESKRKNNSKKINELMDQRVRDVKCQNCNGILKQTRSNSKRARCVDCGALFQLLKLSLRCQTPLKLHQSY